MANINEQTKAISDLKTSIRPQIENEVAKQTADLRTSQFMEDGDKENQTQGGYSQTMLERKVDKSELKAELEKKASKTVTEGILKYINILHN